MRTTITLDDRLLAKLKKRASESGTSVSRLIEQAVRLLMQAPRTARRKEGFELGDQSCFPSGACRESA